MFSIHHVALSVSNLDKSIAFYGKLGFKPFTDWEAEDKSLKIVHLKNDEGFVLELFCFEDPKPAPETTHEVSADLPVLGTKHFGLKVDSLEQTRQRFIQEGIINSSTQINTGRTKIDYFFIKDPDGILVEIVEDNRA